MAREPKVKPTYMSGKRPLRVAVHDIVRLIKLIDDHDLTKKFAAASKRKKALVAVDPDIVNFVKDFMVANNLHDDPIGMHVVNAEGVRAAHDPFDCNFGTHR